MCFPLHHTAPGVNLHQQEQSLHCDDIYLLAVRPGHSQNFQVGEAKDEEAERKAVAVKQPREGGIGTPVRRLLRVHVKSSLGVGVAVRPPAHHQLGQGKSEGLEPGVGDD